MKYDFIFMNPPYNVGGKITKATLNSLTEDWGSRKVILLNRKEEN